MAEQTEFDNIPSLPNPGEGTEVAQQTTEMDGLQKAIKAISCLPCFPKYVAKPDTPNLDKLKLLYYKFTSGDQETRNVEVVERSGPDELAKWTETVLKFLPGVDDTPEGAEGTGKLTEHFDIVKKFYTSAKNAGFDSSELDTFFNSLQIYESVIPLAFFVLQDHPDVLNALTESISKAIDKTVNHGNQSCFMVTMCGAALLTRYNTLLGALDNAIGLLNITSVCELILDLFEVFCRYFNVDLSDSKKLEDLSETLKQAIKVLTHGLKKIFGNILPDVERNEKWGPLRINDKIRNKLAEFDTGSAIIERSMNSFERFFDVVKKCDDKYRSKQLAVEASSRSVAIDVDENDMDNIDLQVVEQQTLSARISRETGDAFEEITQVAQVFQYIDTILTYGILLFKNEDEVLNPLLDRVDECTRILVKFFDMHPLYQVVLGKNYLSKLKVVLKEVLELLKGSKLKINSPKEFMSEVKTQYPNLLYILLQDVLDDKLKKKLEFLPDGLEDQLNGVIDGALDKFKNKFNLF